MHHLQHPIWSEPFELRSKPFTHHYSQPLEHRYSIDSIELCWKLGRILNQRAERSPLVALDLCAGCGVIGFEIAHWCKRIDSVQFIEIQPEYVEHFQENLKVTGRSADKFTLHTENYANVFALPNLSSAFDLILCNPPYFRPESGTTGKSTFKNRCHYFLDSDFEHLCRAIVYCLRPRGEAYVLLKDLSAQGIDPFKELQTYIQGQAQAIQVGRVRGVDVVGISKL
jgi:tRNA1(Val) A37 N6-methylase TrmN6